MCLCTLYCKHLYYHKLLFLEEMHGGSAAKMGEEKGGEIGYHGQYSFTAMCRVALLVFLSLSLSPSASVYMTMKHGTYAVLVL